MERVTLVLPRGRPWETLEPILRRAGVPGVAAADPDRQLVVEGERVRLLFTRPADVVTYVREGVADLGVTGKDVLLEDGSGIVELLELPVGRWRLSVAVPEAGSPWPELLAQRGESLRVATSYPRAAASHFAARGLTPHVVHLRGAVELAAVVGLADCVVDVVDTGRTLAAHGLVEVERIAEVSLRLVANTVSHRLRHAELDALARGLRRALRTSA